MQNRPAGKKSRLQQKATSHRPPTEDIYKKLYQHQPKSKQAPPVREVISSTPITLKPGSLSTVFILGLIGSTLIPRSSAALIPHRGGKFQLELDALATLATEKTYNWWGLQQVNCPEVVLSFTDAVRKNPDALPRVMMVLKDPTVKIACNAGDSVDMLRRGRLMGSTLMNNESPADKRIAVNERGVEPTWLLRTIRFTQNYIFHTSKKCYTDRYTYGVSPVYPSSSRNIDAYNLALTRGDERIMQFKALLERYKSLHMASPYQISADLVSGGRVSSGVNKLVVKHKSPGINMMSQDELILLDKYLAASKTCMLKPVSLVLSFDEYAEISTKLAVDNHNVFAYSLFNNTIAYLYRGDTRIVNDKVEMSSRYAYAFDSVANLVFQVQQTIATTGSRDAVAILAVREAETIASLSAEAIDVFYPELKILMHAEEARCSDMFEDQRKNEL